MNIPDIKSFLNEKYIQYNSFAFIESDPVSIPRRFSKKQDIEIAGFLAATIAWGQRPTIIRNGNRLMQWMDESPHEFILNHSPKDLKPFKTFVHRTFNNTDILYFIKALKHIYSKHKSMEEAFLLPGKWKESDTQEAIIRFRTLFFSLPHPDRSRKHVSDPAAGSAAKRLHMFLRWMVRKDKAAVDFGIWKRIPPSALLCPLDVHSGNVARKLGLLSRTQNDRRAVEELTAALRSLDPSDPVKYDFALFGLGVFEGF
ncbi:MAG TPA: TIGR02757 family protein [Bacteroidia bacterium]|jgi:uncharacterized protein (TIGR02757 family)|nr:TIGR02757 family protein [Bacteroidia bacterium]